MKPPTPVHLAALFIAFALLASFVSASRLEFIEPGGAVTLPDAGASYAVYGRLLASHQIDRVFIRTNGRVPVDITVLVPVEKFNNLFSPEIAIYGPGLPENGYRAVGARTDTIVTEKGTKTDYWERQTLAADLPQNATYELDVFDPDGRNGTYVLQIGQKINFNSTELASTPHALDFIKSFYNEQPVALGALPPSSSSGTTQTGSGIGVAGNNTLILIAVILVAVLFYAAEHFKRKITVHRAHGAHHEEHGGAHGAHEKTAEHGAKTEQETKNHVETPHAHHGLPPGHKEMVPELPLPKHPRENETEAPRKHPTHPES